ncbi:M48 family metallopeptidase, partial [Halochromatium sp.]
TVTPALSNGACRLRWWLSLVLTTILTTALLSCATAPETGRRQLLLVSPIDEAQLGLQAFQQIKQQKPVVKQGKQVATLQRVGARISSVAPLPYARWEFVLFKDKSPNAFALPGGKVGVNTGILPITKSEAGLATVIGHEVAHAVARHGAERMSHGMLVQLGGAGLQAALGDDAGATGDLIMQAYGIGSQLGVMLPYSRTQELEADELGLLYMARAGYDPREALGFWQRFAAYNAKRGGAPPEFLSTHPMDQRRFEALQRVMPRAIAEYERARAER